VVRAIQNTKDYSSDTTQLFNKLSEKFNPGSVVK